MVILLQVLNNNPTEPIQETQTIQAETVFYHEVRSTQKANNTVSLQTNIKEKRITNIANKYNVSPDYLIYIVEIEKELELEPYELLALIAVESGFKPQTHMDGGSLSYSTTQMKLPTAKTAYMAMTKHYKLKVGHPTDKILRNNKYYSTYLAAGYLRYLNDVYKDKHESYTAYNWGIGGRMIFYNQYGHFKSPYAIRVASLQQSFKEYIEG